MHALLVAHVRVHRSRLKSPHTVPPDQITTFARPLMIFGNGVAQFEARNCGHGLPMGESDTIVFSDDTWRSYLHASYQSLGVIDQCGVPVEFPGCLVIFTSTDAGQTFAPNANHAGTPVCQIPCTRCPCDSRQGPHRSATISTCGLALHHR